MPPSTCKADQDPLELRHRRSKFLSVEKRLSATHVLNVLLILFDRPIALEQNVRDFFLLTSLHAGNSFDKYDEDTRKSNHYYTQTYTCRWDESK
jgi:hypothetical protein